MRPFVSRTNKNEITTTTPEDHGFESQPAPHIGGGVGGGWRSGGKGWDWGEGDKGALLWQARLVWDRIWLLKKPTTVASAAAGPLP